MVKAVWSKKMGLWLSRYIHIHIIYIYIHIYIYLRTPMYSKFLLFGEFLLFRGKSNNFCLRAFFGFWTPGCPTRVVVAEVARNMARTRFCWLGNMEGSPKAMFNIQWSDALCVTQLFIHHVVNSWQRPRNLQPSYAQVLWWHMLTLFLRSSHSCWHGVFGKKIHFLKGASGLINPLAGPISLHHGGNFDAG